MSFYIIKISIYLFFKSCKFTILQLAIINKIIIKKYLKI